MKKIITFSFLASFIAFALTISVSSSSVMSAVKGTIFGHTHSDSNVCLTGQNFSRCVKTDKTGKFSFACLDDGNPASCPPSKGQMKVFNEKCPKCVITLDATKSYPS